MQFGAFAVRVSALLALIQTIYCNSFASIPNELYSNILNHLSEREIAKMSLVDRSFLAASRQPHFVLKRLLQYAGSHNYSRIALARKMLHDTNSKTDDIIRFFRTLKNDDQKSVWKLVIKDLDPTEITYLALADTDWKLESVLQGRISETTRNILLCRLVKHGTKCRDLQRRYFHFYGLVREECKHPNTTISEIHKEIRNGIELERSHSLFLAARFKR